MNNCNSCHPAGYALQFRFNEEGWSKVIDLMKVIGNTGVPGTQVNEIIEHNQKPLAAYLSRARGPGRNLHDVQAAAPANRRSGASGLEVV